MLDLKIVQKIYLRMFKLIKIISIMIISKVKIKQMIKILLKITFVKYRTRFNLLKYNTINKITKNHILT